MFSNVEKVTENNKAVMANYTEVLLPNDTSSSLFENPNEPMVVLATGIPIATIIVNLPSIALVIWMTVRKKNVKNIHLVSIGITDALVGVFAYLMGETFVHVDKQFSFYNCFFRYYLFSVTFVASMLHVLGICVQRLKILISGNTTQKQRQFEWAVILVSWLVSGVVNTTAFVFLTTKKRDLKMCSIDSLVQEKQNQFFNFLGWAYATIVLLVAVAMSSLLCLLWIRRRKLAGNQVGAKDVKLCITVTIMGLIFLVGTLPLSVVLLRYESLGESKRHKRSVCTIISLLNSCINPFIYMLRSNDFKQLCQKTNVVADIGNAQ